MAASAPQLLALALIFLACWLVSPSFFSIRLQDGRMFGSIVDVFYRVAPIAILSIGMCLVIASRGIDLSVGAIMAIVGATAGVLVNEGFGTVTCILAALGVGLTCGLWNGFLVAVLRIQPIVATLILMVAGRGIAQLITGGQIITFDDPGLIFLSAGTLFTLPLPIGITILVLVATTLVVRRTALGLFLEATGANARASHYAGVETRLVTIGAYVFSGLCAAIAGLIVAGDIRGADANNAGLWLELDAILAVVLGGGSLLGGRFSLVRSVLGAVIIQAMNTGILLSGFQPEFNLIVRAVVVLCVLLAQSPKTKAALGFLKPAREGGATP
ncbi:sugar ABC transporter permease [Aureimonas sp. Leaf454]|nr:sugar ABC transporter permease [Aureimonas sp. Leaf454]